MSLQVITTDDLSKFKEEILAEIRTMLPRCPVTSYQRLLTSNEVRKLLKISPGELRTLRLNGTLNFSKLQGLLYYDEKEVQQLLLNKNRKNREA